MNQLISRFFTLIHRHILPQHPFVDAGHQHTMIHTRPHLTLLLLETRAGSMSEKKALTQRVKSAGKIPFLCGKHAMKPNTRSGGVGTPGVLQRFSPPIVPPFVLLAA